MSSNGLNHVFCSVGNIDDHEQVETLEVRIEQQTTEPEHHMRDEGHNFRLDQNRPNDTNQNEIDDRIGVFVGVFHLESLHLVDPDDSVVGDKPAYAHEGGNGNQENGSDHYRDLGPALIHVESEILECDFLQVDHVDDQTDEPAEYLTIPETIIGGDLGKIGVFGSENLVGSHFSLEFLEIVEHVSELGFSIVNIAGFMEDLSSISQG